MRFNFRKVASTAASMAMLGSTVALAAAASYPAPFVSGGAADVALVYGSNLDLSAVTEISQSLSSALAGSSSDGGSGDPTGGEFVKLAKSSNNINLGNEVSGVFGVTINDDDLPTLLADGVYRNDENTEFDYEQKITLAPNFPLSFFADNDYEDEEPTIGINMTSSQNILLYTLDFTDNAESDVSSGDLVDIETTDITMMGRNYFIFDVDNATSKITLLDSANSGIVSEGETITVSAGDNSYQVSLSFISSTAAKLNVNGQVTNSLAVGETYRLSDDSYVGIKEINKLEVAGELGTVEFSIGAGKLELPNGNNIELNDESENEIKSYIRRGATTGGKETIDKIEINWTTDDDRFITPSSDLVMPGFGVLKFSMNDFVIPTEEVLDVKDAGTSRMVIDVELEKGRVTVPLLYTNGSGDFIGLGDDANDLLVTSYSRSVTYNDTRGDNWVVLSWNSTTEAEGYIIGFTSFVKETGVNKTTLRWLTEGNTWETRCSELKEGDTCDIGSATITINTIIVDGSNKKVNFTSTDTAISHHLLYTKEGLRIQMPVKNFTANRIGAINITNGTTRSTLLASHSINQWDMDLVEEDKDDNVAAGSNFTIVLGQNSDNEPQVTSYTTASQQFKEIEDDNNLVSRMKSDIGTKVRRIGSSSDQREAEVTYSGSEAYADIFLTDVSASTGSGGELGSVSVMDTELASSGMQSKNLVVVGGTCVNNAASTLLGVSHPSCGSKWTSATGSGPGSWIVQTFTNPWASTKVATLVAGWEQGDTVNAATAFRTLDTIDISAGTKYTGTTATAATAVA